MRYARKPILAVIMLASCFTAPVTAYRLEDLADASVAYGNGDYATALRLLRPLANEGSGIAQCISSGGVFHRTTSKRTCGSTCRRRRADDLAIFQRQNAMISSPR